VCCSVLSRAAVCCSVLQCVAVCLLQCVVVCASHCNITLQHPATRCNTLQVMLQCDAVCCSLHIRVYGGADVYMTNLVYTWVYMSIYTFSFDMNISEYIHELFGFEHISTFIGQAIVDGHTAQICKFQQKLNAFKEKSITKECRSSCTAWVLASNTTNHNFYVLVL